MNIYLERFKQDVQRWIIPEEISSPELVTLPTVLKLLLRHMPLRAMLWYRLGQWLRSMKIPYFPGHIERHLLAQYGLEMSVSSDIEGGLYIAHPAGTVIVASHIGRNCSVIAGVTIGMRNEWAFPVIGDNVFIGAGARVLGDIRLGDGARIGANAVVIDDVPAGATAVGMPARVVRRSPEPVELH